MNIYKELNKVIEYIEENLVGTIDCKEMAKIIGVNEYTFKKIFSVICNTSITEYIRNRRLTDAGQELALKNEKIVDIAVKYGYDNATSFSRAFEKFHGIKPNLVKKNPEKLKMYTRMRFQENYELNKNIEYKIVEKEEMHFYGIYKITTNENIKEEAPKFYQENAEKYGEVKYAMTEYNEKDRMNVKAYWVLYDKEFEGMTKITIPESKWIQIQIKSQETKDIQKTVDTFYREFLPSFKYNLKDLPEFEFYHEGVTEFLIPIED